VASRRARLLAIAFGVFVFLGISFLLTRALTGAGAERTQVLDVLRAQARGDVAGVLRLLPDCARNPTCARLVRERSARLRRPGRVQILNYTPSADVTFTTSEGRARVAWRTADRRYPVVQCVYVRREGPLTGGRVHLISISNPIGLQAGCGS
jgi:hypothetical protein